MAAVTSSSKAYDELSVFYSTNSKKITELPSHLETFQNDIDTIIKSFANNFDANKAQKQSAHCYAIYLSMLGTLQRLGNKDTEISQAIEELSPFATDQSAQSNQIEHLEKISVTLNTVQKKCSTKLIDIWNKHLWQLFHAARHNGVEPGNWDHFSHWGTKSSYYTEWLLGESAKEQEIIDQYANSDKYPAHKKDKWIGCDIEIPAQASEPVDPHSDNKENS